MYWQMPIQYADALACNVMMSPGTGQAAIRGAQHRALAHVRSRRCQIRALTCLADGTLRAAEYQWQYGR